MRTTILTTVALIAIIFNAYSIELGGSEQSTTELTANNDLLAYNRFTLNDTSKFYRGRYYNDSRTFSNFEFDTLKYNPPTDKIAERVFNENLKPLYSLNKGLNIDEPFEINLNINNVSNDMLKLRKNGLSFLNKYIHPTHTMDKWERWKVIGLYSAAIICNGIGDGMNNTHNKTMGHIFNAASIGLLVASPFVVKYDQKKWYWYLLTYTSLRLALFDATYNVTTKQPIDFVGTTAITDKLYRAVGVGYDVSKSLGFVFGLTIPLRLL